MRLLRIIKALVPSRLPISGSELDIFTSDVLYLGDWAETDAHKNAVATMILHIPSDSSLLSRLLFFLTSKLQMYLTLRRSIANQIAYSRMEQFKQQQQLEREKQANEQAKEAASAVVQET